MLNKWKKQIANSRIRTQNIMIHWLDVTTVEKKQMKWKKKK